MKLLLFYWDNRCMQFSNEWFFWAHDAYFVTLAFGFEWQSTHLVSVHLFLVHFTVEQANFQKLVIYFSATRIRNQYHGSRGSYSISIRNTVLHLHSSSIKQYHITLLHILRNKIDKIIILCNPCRRQRFLQVTSRKNLSKNLFKTHQNSHYGDF